MYSEATLNELRNQVSIVDVVSEYVPLKKSGQGYSGLCPFHGEKTPSFHVHPQKQIFHCFGCQKGGNVFTFLIGVEGITFPEAVQRLAKRVGYTLEEDSRRKPAYQAPKPNERLTAALEWAAKYFNYLLKQTPEFQYVREYVKKRGLSEKSIDRFQIGVSPKGWNTLLDHMTKRNFTFQEIVDAGLVVPKEGSKTGGYDRFRERLMFPIRNADGMVIGFGARLLKDEANQPKYLNSPESPLFSKRRQLYGIYENQRGIRLQSEAVIVEGYMDVVGLSEKGVQNAIATMGTALTEEHCSTIKQLTNRVVTVFDPDQGGQEAWHRSVHLFLSHGIFAKDLSLPDELDPDEFIQKEGTEAFYKLCEKAPRQVTKLLREIAAQGTLSEQETAQHLEELTPILMASRRLPDRALLWDSISLVLKVSHDALKELSEPTLSKPARTEEERVPPKNDRPAIKKPPEKSYDALDFEFFQAALQWPAEFLKLPHPARVDLLKEPSFKRWLTRLGDVNESFGFGKFLEEVSQNEPDARLQALASSILISKLQEVEPPPEKSKKTVEKSTLESLFQRLSQRLREMEIKALSAQIKLTEKMGDPTEGLRLLERLKELRSS